MKRASTILFVLILVASCSKEQSIYQSQAKAEPTFHGIWINQQTPEMEVVLSIEETSQVISVRLLGDDVVPLDYKKMDNQALIKFKNNKGEIFHLLAQVNDKQEMRMSVTMEEVTEFVPIGRLGEKVYRLRKMESQPSLITASNQKRKKLN